MIKRHLYKQDREDRGRGDSSSSSSSSSSESDSEAEPQYDEEVDIEAIPDVKQQQSSSPSPGLGYESEDSSGNEVGSDPSGYDSEEGTGSGRHRRDVEAVRAQSITPAKKEFIPSDISDRILKCNSVFKCRLCPRIVCLTEDSLRAHLASKRHARSEKLLSAGRLKLMLNSDGEIEEDVETHAERHARTIALAQDAATSNQKKNCKGRQRQKQRQKLKLKRKKPTSGGLVEDKEKPLAKNQAKKRRKKTVD